MTFKEKLCSIEHRLGLSKKHLSQLLKIKENDLTKLEQGELEPSKKTLDTITRVFHIDEYTMLDETKSLKDLSFSKEIDLKRYKNIFLAYGEILKEYFSEHSEIYVLSKFKVKKKIESILDLFFKNDRASIINEMKTFSPSYLIKKGNINLLVTFENDTFNVFELQNLEDEKNFIFDNYKYRKENQITLK